MISGAQMEAQDGEGEQLEWARLGSERTRLDRRAQCCPLPKLSFKLEIRLGGEMMMMMVVVAMMK